jgi:hypothetical protein
VGRVAAVLAFARTLVGDVKASDVTVDRGGGDNRTPQHFSDVGDDSFPLPQDFVASVDQTGTGRESAVGYIDPKNEQKSTAGDKRIYARDAATGEQVAEVWLKNDGTAATSNANGSAVLAPDGSTTVTTPASTFECKADGSIAGTNGSGDFELTAGGDFVVNGVTIAADGTVTIPASLTLAGKEIAGHGHPITGGSSAPGPTGPNN